MVESIASNDSIRHSSGPFIHSNRNSILLVKLCYVQWTGSNLKKKRNREERNREMLELAEIWALVEVIGLLCLPLTLIVFRNLPDRGWAFSKSLGVTIFTFAIWLPLMCFHELPYSQTFLWAIGVLLLVISLAGFWLIRHSIRRVLNGKRSYLLLTEGIFLGMLALLGFLRQFRPDIRSWEGLMDEGIIAGIMRSPHFPPNDVWYSGYSINYYYYAHFIAATLGKTLGQSPSIVFNTGISLFFSLTAVNLFGISTNIVAWAKQTRFQHKAPQHPISYQSDSASEPAFPDTPPLLQAAPFGLCSLAMGVLFGNLASANQEWIDIKTNFAVYKWFSPSRVIPPTINEFPAFSFLLSDFHAHVLTLPFTILALAVAFHLFIGKGERGINVFGLGWHLPLKLLASALIIGQLFVMNGWDYPTYLALTLVCLALHQWLAHNSRFSLNLVLDVLTAGVALGVVSYLLFLPFYLNFISPAQGLGLVNAQGRSPFGDELLIYGLFAFIFVSFLLASFFHLRSLPSPATSTGSRIVPPAQSIQEDKSGALAKHTLPEEGKLDQHPGSISSEDERVQPQLEETSVRVLPEPPFEEEKSKTAEPLIAAGPVWLNGRFIAVLITLIVALIVLLLLKNSVTFVVTAGLAAIAATLTLHHLPERSRAFLLLLGAVALALIAFCEVIYLKDAFADTIDFRMNTVFKLYYQAWMLFSVACGSGIFFLLEAFWPRARHVQGQLQKRSRQIPRAIAIPWTICLILLVLASLTYPLLAPSARLSTYDNQTHVMAMTPSWSLDGMAYLQSCRPPDLYPSMDSDPTTFCQYDVTHDYAAIRWINAHIQGDPILVEAANATTEDYSLYALVSSFTGLPTIMGWPGHQVQWRLNWLQNPDNAKRFDQRLSDINTIYTSPDPQTVLRLMRQYHARYLYVGAIEHAAYPHSDLARFASFLPTVYDQDGVVIYQLPSA
jgi:uncharacterized membrane protein